MKTADHPACGPGKAVLAEPMRIKAVRLGDFSVECTSEEATFIAMR
jgi:hypothetical protein